MAFFSIIKSESDWLTIEGDNMTNHPTFGDKLENVEYEVVGKVQTPYYLSFEKGISSIGNGKISSFIVIPQENFKIPAYMEVYVTVEGAKELNSYSNK